MSISAAPPKFEKKKHHFVPRFWLRGFADGNNRIWKRRDGQVTQAGLDDIMSEDWIYTIFDDWWRPSDALEDAFAAFEAVAAEAFKAICAPNAEISEDHWRVLLQFLGLTACRHPDIMSRTNELGKAFAWNLADAHAADDKNAFLAATKHEFGLDLPDECADAVMSKSVEELFEEACLVEGLSPQDPRLPQQDSVRATLLVANGIAQMDLDILDAPSGHSYILSDRPLPLKRLCHGFSVPLSATVAIKGAPKMDAQATQHRSIATVAELDAINQEQAGRAKATLIGPDRTFLRSLTI